MKSRNIIGMLVVTLLATTIIDSKVTAKTIDNSNVYRSDKSIYVANTFENMTLEKEQFITPFRLEFNGNVESIINQDAIILDGNMSDWSEIPYIGDVDKYGVHGEDITGVSYYIDENSQYLYLQIGMNNNKVNHIRVWCVKNKDTFNEFLRRYNTGGGLETELISILENDNAGVISFSTNVEKLTSSEPIRVQVLNHNANVFKEQGYWVDEVNNKAEFRIPLNQLTGPDGSHNFDLVIGTDLYNWPTGDFMMISISSGSTVPFIAGICGLILVILIALKLRAKRNTLNS